MTLLVGGNSTGKTSFLGLIRCLWNVAIDEVVPDFREEPYDLGTFRDIAHYRGGRGGSADFFRGGLHYDGRFPRRENIGRESIDRTVIFTEREGVPFPATRRVETGGLWVEVETKDDGQCRVSLGNPRQSYEKMVPDFPGGPNTVRLRSLRLLVEMAFGGSRYESVESDFEAKVLPTGDSPTREDLKALIDLVSSPRRRTSGIRGVTGIRRGPFASAPVRSHPRRTYDPAQPFQDPRGDYVPTYLANISRRDNKEWTRLKLALEGFGKSSGLFDEISIESFGKTDADPFQIKVRKFGRRSKGGRRNIIDVGYGVSQTLPILAEIFSVRPAPLTLLQQPEVHLHPSAQAALGTLFCTIARPGRQLIVETHSDYILDRVRMDVRDGTTNLKPEDVSILFFEPDDLDVKIHSLRVDRNGNVVDAPPGYRDFFMKEVRRSVGI